jgi:flagellar hook assembly protein FlgD
LSFGGSLVIDSKLQQVVKNALFLAYHHVTAVGDDASGATAFTLARNEPNPFGSETLIRYSLPSAGAVRLHVYDVQGREVARLVDRLESAGSHQAHWNGLTRRGQPAPAGVYYYKLEEGTKSLSGRMILLR